MNEKEANPERIFGVYGFHFTRSFDIVGVRFLPLFGYPESKKRAEDESSLQLTGYGQFFSRSPDEAELLYLLTAGMTFAQQQRVATTTIIEISPGDTIADVVGADRLGRALPLLDYRQSFGSAIQDDEWARDSRATFLSTFVKRFSIKQPNDALRLAFFRQLEICRLATPYVELHHFLAFSALELVARSQSSGQSRGPAAIPITKLLNNYGFKIKQEEVQNWCDARNKAFHEGLLRSTNSRGVEINLSDQLYVITQVLCDVLLKLLPFDDGHINWNRWRDRMPFK